VARSRTKRRAPRLSIKIANAIDELHYLNARSRGGTEVARLPFQRAELHLADAPDELAAIIACSDLQGRAPGPRGEARLLGIAVAEHLEALADAGMIPPLVRTGVLLAGDLYSVPEANKRGGHGDVAEVWAAFAERFPWVAGVAGNHDDVTGIAALDAPNVHLLDGTIADVDGLVIGGVGGIIGNPEKKMRRDTDTFLRTLDGVLDHEPDIVVLHEGPHGDLDRHQLGNSDVRATIDAGGVDLTVCGHVHWHDALAAHPAGMILNVDARVVVMIRAT
jgi:3',5'-cyclic-AMP phosphodiesterase